MGINLFVNFFVDFCDVDSQKSIKVGVETPRYSFIITCDEPEIHSVVIVEFFMASLMATWAMSRMINIIRWGLQFKFTLDCEAF